MRRTPASAAIIASLGSLLFILHTYHETQYPIVYGLTNSVSLLSAGILLSADRRRSIARGTIVNTAAASFVGRAPRTSERCRLSVSFSLAAYVMRVCTKGSTVMYTLYNLNINANGLKFSTVPVISIVER